MVDINKIKANLNLTITYSPILERKGCYIAEHDLIIINSNLSEHEQQETLLHELGHACLHKNELALYNTTFSNHSKMEYQADCFKVAHLLDEYLKTSDTPPNSINYCHFMEANKIDFGLEGYIRELVKQKTTLLSCG